MRFRFLCAAMALFVLIIGVGCGGGGGSSEPAVVTPAAPVLPSLEVEFVSSTSTKTFVADKPGTGDVGEFVVTYLVTAIGGDVHVDNSCTEIEGLVFAPDGNVFTVTNNDSNDIFYFLSSTADVDSSGSFRVREGETEAFMLTVIVIARADHFVQVSLEAIGWASTPGEGEEMLILDPEQFGTDGLFLNYGDDYDYGYDDGGYDLPTVGGKG